MWKSLTTRAGVLNLFRQSSMDLTNTDTKASQPRPQRPSRFVELQLDEITTTSGSIRPNEDVDVLVPDTPEPKLPPQLLALPLLEIQPRCTRPFEDVSNHISRLRKADSPPYDQAVYICRYCSRPFLVAFVEGVESWVQCYEEDHVLGLDFRPYTWVIGRNDEDKLQERKRAWTKWCGFWTGRR